MAKTAESYVDTLLIIQNPQCCEHPTQPCYHVSGIDGAAWMSMRRFRETVGYYTIRQFLIRTGDNLKRPHPSKCSFPIRKTSTSIVITHVLKTKPAVVRRVLTNCSTAPLQCEFDAALVQRFPCPRTCLKLQRPAECCKIHIQRGNKKDP